ncbi:MAG: MBL fold metallo-hydrolase [Nitrososphaerales archaeon]
MEIASADKVEVITLVDDYVNGTLPGHDYAERSKYDTICFPFHNAEPMQAEFGWSSLIKIKKGSNVHTILFDTSVGKQALLHNARVLNIDLKMIDALVLSHGHPDHTAATFEVVSAIDRDELPIVLHPEALFARSLVLPGYKPYELSRVADYPSYLDAKKLHEVGGRLEKNVKPTSLASDTTIVTGEIPRVTGYEKGMPPDTHYIKKDGVLVHDPLIVDDQSIVINLKDKGLIVISGCAHAGIINTLEYAKQITGIDKIHAVIGGFHLSSRHYEQIMDWTVKSLKKLNPDVVIPSHCTGLRALIQIANALPEAFVENSVGTTFQFGFW